MIEYSSGSFGFQLLSLRLDGSAVFKSIAPSILSSIIYIVLFINYDTVHFSNSSTSTDNNTNTNNEPILIHPYPMGALIAALTYLLTFRANFSYNRYWEAVTAVHTMHSRWLDASSQITAFHLQSSIYNTIKPPSLFNTNTNRQYQQQQQQQQQTCSTNTTTINRRNNDGKNVTLTSRSRSRTRTNEPTVEELEILIDQQKTQQELDTTEEFALAAAAAAADVTTSSTGLDCFTVETSHTPTTTTTTSSNNNDDTTHHIHLNNTTRSISPMSRALTNIQHFISSPKNDMNEIQQQEQQTIDDSIDLPMQQQQQQQQSEDALLTCNDNTSINFTHDATTEAEVKSRNTPFGGSIQKRKVSFFHCFSRERDDKDDEQKLDEQTQHKAKKTTNTHSSSIPKQCIVSTETTYEIWKNRYAPVYLRELAHLISLLSAVALSGLRNDIAGCESPLAVFTPGAPWPHVDPNSYSTSVRQSWSGTTNRYWELVKYLVNISRTPEARTLYNAARPFRVIGGISDNEVLYLKNAKNPSAKVTLVFMWVIEYITRESRYGATGIIEPPILTRTYQLLSDGMTSYNQARKVAYIPFPFPHAQITALYTLLVSFLMPILMLQFVTSISFGFLLNFLTVMCFTGLQEVSRELESPFLNEPNDIPLNNYQAQFNESLLIMFAGYHPDFYK